MKMKIRVYRYEDTLEGDFSSIEEAQRVVEVMYEKNPDLIFEPYIDLGDSCTIDIYELDRKELAYELDSEELVFAPSIALT
jgi:hypothetical protein